MPKAALPKGERPGHEGGAEGTRTPDPHTASVVRYQLRHSPLPTRSGVSEPSTTIQTGRPRPGGGSQPEGDLPAASPPARQGEDGDAGARSVRLRPTEPGSSARPGRG